MFTPISYLYVEFAEVRTEEGRQYLFIAINRTSMLAFAELHPRATRMVSADFLRRVQEKLPYKDHSADQQWGAIHVASPPMLAGQAQLCPHMLGLRRGAPTDQTGVPLQQPGQMHEPHH